MFLMKIIYFYHNILLKLHNNLIMTKIITSQSEITWTLFDVDNLEPTVENSWEWKNVDWTSKTISEIIDFWYFQWSFWWENNISIYPTSNQFCSVIDWKWNIPIELENISSAHHRLEVVKWEQKKLDILEHISSVSSALWVNFDIDIKWVETWPTLEDSINLFASKIDEKLEKQNNDFKYFTVEKSIKIEFPGKRWSYIMLLPDDWSNKLILDLSIKYPWKSIWEQRIVFEVNDEDYLNYVSKARTNAFWRNQKALKILNSKYFPATEYIRNNFLNFWYDNVFAFDENNIINPIDTFSREDWIYTEVLYHNILDLLWALWIDSKIDWEHWYRFLWKVVAFANSHENDLTMMNMMKNWNIPIKKL